MPCFQDWPRGMTGHCVQPEPLGAHRLPHVDVGVARGPCTCAAYGRPGGVLDDRGTPWCRARGGRRARPSGAPGPGSKSADRRRPGRRRRRASRRRRPRRAGRRPRPSRPARRRGGPRRRSGTRWPPWRGRPRRPATRSPCGRLRARASASCGAGRRGGRGEDDRRAVEEEARARAGSPWCARAGPRGARRACRRPSRRAPRRRTSRSRRPRPPGPVSASTSRERPRGGTFQSPDRTSAP